MIDTIAVPSLSRTSVTQSGQRIDLSRPAQRSIRIADIAEHLARLSASVATRGFYSYAQRALLLADAAFAETKEPEAACQALLYYAPLAFTGAPSAAAIAVIGAKAQSALAATWTNLAAAIHAAHGMAFPHNRAQLLVVLHARVELTELKTLRHGVDAEILSLEQKGVRTLPRAIQPMSFNAAAEKYLDAWSRYRIAAGFA